MQLQLIHETFEQVKNFVEHPKGNPNNNKSLSEERKKHWMTSENAADNAKKWHMTLNKNFRNACKHKELLAEKCTEIESCRA